MSPTVSRGQWWGVNTFACGCTQVVVVVYTHLCVYQTNRQLCCQRLLSSRGLISPRPVYNTQECKAVMICGLLACFNGVECGRLTVLPLPDHYTELTRDRDCHFVIFLTPPPPPKRHGFDKWRGQWFPSLFVIGRFPYCCAQFNL